MECTRIRLDPQAIEEIARRVVEILKRRGSQGRELVDAAELARRLGIERAWVYSHAVELGAAKLGDGLKARLCFDPEMAARVLRRVGDGPVADPPARSGKRAGQPSGSEGTGVRSGARGGPLAIEPADLGHVLLALIDRSNVEANCRWQMRPRGAG